MDIFEYCLTKSVNPNKKFKPMGCHMYFVPQPPSSYSDDPPNCIVLCSSITDSTLVVNEDQASNGVGVAKPTCVVIHEEYDWDLDHQPSAMDESLLSEPPPFFSDIFCDSSIPDFACVSPSTNAPIVDHLQNTPDVSPSYDNGEDKLFIENPLDFSSAFSRNTEGEFFRFSSTPLFDSSDLEDTDEIIDFSDHSCHDLFTPIFDHDDDSIVVYFSKPPIYDDLSIDEVEMPQTIEALQPTLMVM